MSGFSTITGDFVGRGVVQVVASCKICPPLLVRRTRSGGH